MKGLAGSAFSEGCEEDPSSPLAVAGTPCVLSLSLPPSSHAVRPMFNFPSFYKDSSH